MSENALIIKSDMYFTGNTGVNGENFILHLDLKTAYGGVGVTFNPMKLPQLLKQLNLKKFSELEGTYVQISDTQFGEEVTGLKSIMAKSNEEWFETENNIYFGSEFFRGYDL